MPRAKRDAAQRLLEQQAREVFDAPQIAGPQPANYGVYGPAFAAATQQASLDPYFGGTNRIGLQLHSLGEDRAYAEELAATREAQLRAQDTAARYGLYEKSLDMLPDDMPIGTMGAPRRDAEGYWELPIDPVHQATYNVLEADKKTTDNNKTKADTYGVLADLGMLPPAEEVARGMQGPLETSTPPENLQPYMTPKDATARYAADQGLTTQQQFTMEQLKQVGALERARVSAQANDGKWKAVINPNVIDPATGQPQVTYTFNGTPDELAAQGLSPPGRIHPKADARAPSASATQGSRNLVPIEDAKTVAMQLFPMIDITDHKRDPNSRLGRANPDSWHNRSGAAIDSKRIPGMSFNQYVQRYKDAGYEIIEAIDEYENPSRHATGKHWHVVLGQRRQPARQQQARGEPSVRLDRITAIMRRAQERGGTIEQVGDNVVITSPDGRKRTYDANGNVTGA